VAATIKKKDVGYRYHAVLDHHSRTAGGHPGPLIVGGQDHEKRGQTPFRCLLVVPAHW